MKLRLARLSDQAVYVRIIYRTVDGMKSAAEGYLVGTDSWNEWIVHPADSTDEARRVEVNPQAV